MLELTSTLKNKASGLTADGKQKISLFYKGNPLLVCKKSFSASRGKKIIVIPK